jgi:hypothetical protein
MAKRDECHVMQALVELCPCFFRLCQWQFVKRSSVYTLRFQTVHQPDEFTVLLQHLDMSDWSVHCQKLDGDIGSSMPRLQPWVIVHELHERIPLQRSVWVWHWF